MTDVRPRWVHYRQQDHCELALLHLSGRVTSLVEPERFPGLCYAFFEVRDADRRPPHGAAGDAGTWHDLDECVPVPPPAPPDPKQRWALPRLTRAAAPFPCWFQLLTLATSMPRGPLSGRW